jgi:hypothetical protein
MRTLSAATQNTNHPRVFLTATDTNLITSAGYFIRADTSVRLHKTTATPALISSSPLPNENLNVFVKVTRSTTGSWELFVNGVSQGTATDNDATLTTSTAFGTQIRYSADGRSGQFFFDSLLMKVPLNIQQISVANDSTLIIRFTEVIAKNLVENIANYTIAPSINPISAVRSEADSSVVTLVFSTKFADGVPQTITINNITDKAGYASFAVLSSNFTYVAPIIDLTPPTISQFSVVTNDTFIVRFSEFVERTTAELTTNYTVGGVNPVSAVRLTDSSQVRLVFSPALIANNSYTLTIGTITDTAGNNATNLSTNFFIFGRGSLRISEISPDPNRLPSGTWAGAGEFLEIYNTTPQAVQLQGFTINTGTAVALPNFLLPANGYVTLGTHKDTALFRAQNRAFIPFTTSTSYLTNGGETLTLADASGKVIDVVTYSSAWNNLSNGTLELINPMSECVSEDKNWKNSTNAAFATPSAQNSIYSTAPDTTKPVIQNITINIDTVNIVFGKKMNQADLLTVANFVLRDSGNNLLSILNISTDADLTTARIKLNSPIQIGVVYTVSVSDLKDCSGNLINAATRKFGIGNTPRLHELIITEIMADPDPAVGLPNAEYFELFNRTNRILELEGTKMTAGSTTATFPKASLLPGEYVTVCPNSTVTLLQPFGRTIGLSGWSTSELNNRGEPLALTNTFDEVIFELTYSDTWYKDDIKADGGYSLEMIDTDLPCLEEPNWRASNDSKGGTPSAQNSIKATLSDAERPFILSVSVLSPTIIGITFSEKMSPIGLNNTANYTISNGLLIAEAEATSANSIRLTFTQNIDSNTVYSLAAANLTDCVGNTVLPAVTQFGIGAQANFNDILITEIMADPTPVIGLPEMEYLEIYNRSNRAIDLNNATLSDATTTVRFGSVVILPQQYLLVTATSGVALMQRYGKTVGLSGWSTTQLNNSGEQLVLRRADGKLIFEITYSDAWYKNAVKKDGGYALEMIDTNTPCLGESNWTASENPNGGTPALPNSVAATAFDNAAPLLLRADVVSRDTVRLAFNEKIDSLSTTNAQITISDGINVTKVRYSIKETDKLFVILANPLQVKIRYRITISGITDCSGNLINTPQEAFFILPEQGTKGEIILNEVLFNPPTNGVDFVELYNNSDKAIDLRNWSLGTFNSKGAVTKAPITTNILILNPHEYIALTEDIPVLQSQYPNASPYFNRFFTAPLPTMPDAKGTVLLFNNQDSLLERFDYNQDMFLAWLDDKNGVSLERVSFTAPVNDKNSWKTASTSVNYGTPGYLNSQYLKGGVSDLEDCFTVNPQVFTPDNDGVFDYTTIKYECNRNDQIANITIFDAHGRLVRTLVTNQLLSTAGFYAWDGTNDEGLKVRVGQYIAFVQTHDVTGSVNHIKLRIVLGAKF